MSLIFASIANTLFATLDVSIESLFVLLSTDLSILLALFTPETVRVDVDCLPTGKSSSSRTSSISSSSNGVSSYLFKELEKLLSIELLEKYVSYGEKP